MLRHLDDAAEAWLGYTRPPASRALAESGWLPDSPEAYCRRCGESAGPGEVTPTGCGACRERAAPADAVIRLGTYTGPLREWVRALKYEGWGEIGALLGRRLGAAVAASDAVAQERLVTVPMPMPAARRLHRGIDHAAVLGRAAAAELGAPVVPMLARRHGPPQVTLALTDRRRRGGRELRLRWRCAGRPLEGVDVLLVDDVRTTGATIRAAARCLRGWGPRRIAAAVVAVTDDRSRRGRSRPPERR